MTILATNLAQTFKSNKNLIDSSSKNVKYAYYKAIFPKLCYQPVLVLVLFRLLLML